MLMKRKGMGILLTREHQIENITEDIVMTDKFDEYQEKFENLTPSRGVYIEDGELIIETIGDSPYSISVYEFDWLDPDVEYKVYQVLDKLYDGYLGNSLDQMGTVNTIFRKCHIAGCETQIIFDGNLQKQELKCTEHQNCQTRLDGTISKEVERFTFPADIAY